MLLKGVTVPTVEKCPTFTLCEVVKLEYEWKPV